MSPGTALIRSANGRRKIDHGGIENVILTRTDKGPNGIFSRLTDDDGTVVCVTGEHAYAQADGSWEAKLGPGAYTCERYASPHFGYDVFLIQHVPGHDHIEIHRGSFCQLDSDGCVLLGSGTAILDGVKIVIGSRGTFEQFMQDRIDLITFPLTVVDPFPKSEQV
jgi:hypothetical protein